MCLAPLHLPVTRGKQIRSGANPSELFLYAQVFRHVSRQVALGCEVRLRVVLRDTLRVARCAWAVRAGLVWRESCVRGRPLRTLPVRGARGGQFPIVRVLYSVCVRTASASLFRLVVVFAMAGGGVVRDYPGALARFAGVI